MKFNEILPADKVRNMNPVVLAFVGDAVYTLYVREKVVSSGDYKTGALNKMAAQTVCASAQARLAEQISTFFTEAENDVFRRARNAKKTSRAVTAREAKKSLLQTFWCGIARSTQFHKFKLNVIACFTMKKHINHNAKLIHT